MNRVMIAGTASGSGKTTVTCALLSMLKDMGKDVISFKCGPDYIDPMFHEKVTLVPARNLDIFLMGEENVKHVLSYHTQSRDFALIEGVMGLYDGVGSRSYASANHLSVITETPVILVVNAKGKSQSICAEIKGYLEYEKNNICAVILNNTSGAMYTFYKDMIESQLHVKVAGFLPSISDIHIKSRHLGLITANEISDIQDKMKLLAERAKECVDLDMIMEIAQQAGLIEEKKGALSGIESSKSVKIYVAEDEAFCFRYEDNHEILRKLGADICYFSPLRDSELPDDADGLILWGGYPELHAKELECNEKVKSSIRQKIKNGMPVYAECGGFMYLQEKLTDSQGEVYDMLGILEGRTEMRSQLQKFGYVDLTANCDNWLCKKGEKIKAHSFRYSVSSHEGNEFTATKRSNSASYQCIVATDNIFAGYPHIHFLGNESMAENFIQACQNYSTTCN